MRLDQNTRPANRSHLERWIKWLRTQPGWEQVTPRELLVRHLDSEDSYLVLDLLQQYVNSLVLRKSSKRKAYSIIRSFFVHNRCGLPTDPSFHIKGDKPPVQAKLSPSDIYEILLTAELRYRSMLLFKWQSFQDNARLICISSHSAEQLVDQIKSDLHPVREIVKLPNLWISQLATC